MHYTLRQMPERLKPLAAVLAIARLIQNPQDTSQVFRLTHALRGRSHHAAYLEFRNTKIGARIIAERRSLMDTLANRAWLATLPTGSLGRAYLNFMAKEQLTAEGLADLAEQNLNLPADLEEGSRRYAGRMRDMHDLYHVLAGYGRDELGEVCVLAFSYPQQKIRSFWVISRIGAVHIWLELRRFGQSPRGVVASVREAAAHGKRAAWLPGEDIETLLSENLEDLRALLSIPAPKTYLETISRIRRETGILSGPLQAPLKTRVPVQPQRR